MKTTKLGVVRRLLSVALLGSCACLPIVARGALAGVEAHTVSMDEPSPGEITEEEVLPDAMQREQGVGSEEYQSGEPKPPMETPFTPQPYFPEIPQFMPDMPPIP